MDQRDRRVRDYIGEKPDKLSGGTPPKKTRSGLPPGYLKGGSPDATSLKAASKPTYWRRGGFVTRKG